jgi:cytochrome c oxidase subunit 2
MSDHHDSSQTNDLHTGESHTVDTHTVDAGTGASIPIHVDRYEGAWMRISFAILVIFFITITVSAFSTGFQVPGVYQRIDPATLMDPGSPFAQPEVRELAPGRYEVYIRAQIWFFTPGEIRVPAGSKITFYTTSQDVQHGVKVLGTNINMMILPGQVSTMSATFNEPGTYNFVCHEYCGISHHTMYGQIVVEEVLEDEENTAEAEATLLGQWLSSIVQ